jgi:hypothetical protein
MHDMWLSFEDMVDVYVWAFKEIGGFGIGRYNVIDSAKTTWCVELKISGGMFKRYHYALEFRGGFPQVLWLYEDDVPRVRAWDVRSDLGSPPDQVRRLVEWLGGGA